MRKIVFPRKIGIAAILITNCYFIANAQSTPWKAPASAEALVNPVPSTPASIAEGKDLYQTNCSPCHGTKGKGDGAAAAALNPAPADHSSAFVQNEKDGVIFWKLSEGRNTMPPYKGSFSVNQRWALVNYIKTLGAKPKKQK